MTKQKRHKAIMERARNALLDLYHNATPPYPRLDDSEGDEFGDWLEEAASWEIEYINDGGAYGPDYRKTLEAPCNAGRFNSPAARRYYVRHGLRVQREDQARYGAWERISEYGTLYTYGRGGRTLAPEHLIQTRGGSGFSIREDYCEDLSIEDVVRLISTVEAFNAYVKAWCAGVPDMWREEKAERLRAA